MTVTTDFPLAKEFRADHHRYMKALAKARVKRGLRGPRTINNVDILRLPKPYSAVVIRTAVGTFIASPGQHAHIERKQHERSDRVLGVYVHRRLGFVEYCRGTSLVPHTLIDGNRITRILLAGQSFTIDVDYGEQAQGGSQTALIKSLILV